MYIKTDASRNPSRAWGVSGLGRGRVWHGWGVDEAHCCDTSRSLRLMIGQHSKVTSSEQGCNLALVKQLLYRSDMSIQYPTELASLACTF